MKVNLRNHMSQKLISINHSATAAEAYKHMTSNSIRHLPVVDEAGEYIVGMLSDRDLLRAPGARTPVKELMSYPVKTFDVETPLQRVVKTMIKEKLFAFIVTRQDQIEGIVTSEDMLVLLSQILDEEESAKWFLSEFLVNPIFQQTLNMTSQAGI